MPCGVWQHKNNFIFWSNDSGWLHEVGCCGWEFRTKSRPTPHKNVKHLKHFLNHRLDLCIFSCCACKTNCFFTTFFFLSSAHHSRHKCSKQTVLIYIFGTDVICIQRSVGTMPKSVIAALPFSASGISMWTWFLFIQICEKKHCSQYWK